MGNKH